MKALVTGATGFVGQKLVSLLDSPVVLSRNPGRARDTLPEAHIHAWEPEIEPPPVEALDMPHRLDVPLGDLPLLGMGLDRQHAARGHRDHDR